ncbi:hypothetical protein CEXT_303911 [Caerostris extrusa]|uniref:Uncharacterized protein n=1 Tax=Caerostris extrusa TaxID=172846 RepID=A0AAV4SFZ2_CAEEX|nr:hypothetical protein CEXT_303911 [Caerostris extrusa]
MIYESNIGHKFPDMSLHTSNSYLLSCRRTFLGKKKKRSKKLSKEVWGTGIIQSARCHGILPVGHQAVKRARLLSPNRNPDDKRPPRDVINRFHDDSQEGRH